MYKMTVTRVAKALMMADYETRRDILEDAEIFIEKKYDEYENVEYPVEMIYISKDMYYTVLKLASAWRNSGCGWGKVDYSMFRGVEGFNLLDIKLGNEKIVEVVEQQLRREVERIFEYLPKDMPFDCNVIKDRIYNDVQNIVYANDYVVVARTYGMNKKLAEFSIYRDSQGIARLGKEYTILDYTK